MKNELESRHLVISLCYHTLLLLIVMPKVSLAAHLYACYQTTWTCHRDYAIFVGQTSLLELEASHYRFKMIN
jgi:hypothetical protein